MRLIAALALALLPFAAPADEPKKADNGPIVKHLIEQTNAFRKEEKVAELKVSKKLTQIAQAHADNLAKEDKRGDNGNPHILYGKNASDRAKDGGYDYSALAENIAWCKLSNDDRVGRVQIKGWKESPGHRKNLLNGDYKEVGIGSAKSKSGAWFSVAVYGTPDE